MEHSIKFKLADPSVLFGIDWGSGNDYTAYGFYTSSGVQPLTDKEKIRIHKGQPINTSVFEEAEVVE